MPCAVLPPSSSQTNNLSNALGSVGAKLQRFTLRAGHEERRSEWRRLDLCLAILTISVVAALPVRSCFIDGKAIVVDSTGLSVFDLLRYRQHDGAAVLRAFDLIELDGEDLRRARLEDRKRNTVIGV
jgi:hypothetical protein